MLANGRSFWFVHLPERCRRGYVCVCMCVNAATNVVARHLYCAPCTPQFKFNRTSPQVYHSTKENRISYASHQNTSKSTHRPLEREHMAADIPLREACACIRKQVVPLALERIVRRAIAQRGVVARHEVLREVRVESAAPLAQCPGIVCRASSAHCTKVRTREGDVRAAWSSTPASAKRPWPAVCAAVMSAVALGRHEFGHM